METTLLTVTANGILLVHAAWVIFLMTGFLIVRGHPWAERVHFGGLVLNLVLDLTGTPCPLTVAETALRLRCDPATAYQGSCLPHYLGSILPQVPWKVVQVWGGVLMVVIALWRYRFPHGMRIVGLR